VHRKADRPAWATIFHRIIDEVGECLSDQLAMDLATTFPLGREHETTFFRQRTINLHQILDQPAEIGIDEAITADTGLGPARRTAGLAA